MDSDYFGKVGTNVGTDRPDPLVLWQIVGQYPHTRKGGVPVSMLQVQCTSCRSVTDRKIKGEQVEEDDLMDEQAYKLALGLAHKDGCSVPLMLATEQAVKRGA